MASVLPGRSKDAPWQDFFLIERAFALAAEVHRNHFRKGGTVPYLSHLWSVAALVLEHGGDDGQVAAALLHDSAEDGGGEPMLDRIAAELNDDVAQLVRHLSDSLVDTTAGVEKEAWDTRKQRYLSEIGHADERVLLVSACDKLHNLRSLLSDLRSHGASVWGRFSEPNPERQLRYYESLVEAFRGRIPSALERELTITLQDLRAA